MAEFADSADGNEGQDTATDFQVEATEVGFVSLPDGFSLSDATFESDGSDLLLTGADGARVTVEGFFAQDNPPELVSADGAQISGDMATRLAGGGNDFINAGAGDYTLLGGTGDDVLIGGAGADILDGGDGIDTADYSGDVTGVVVNLETGLGFGSGGDAAEGDTLIDIENVTGGSGDDILTGDGGDNVLTGGSGDDIIIGGAGQDTTIIDGDFGNYTITQALDDNGVYQTSVTLADADGAAVETDTISGVEIIQFDDALAENPSVISGTDGEPIGNIENLSGSVFAIHTDGTRVELKEGDSVFQGDIIESTSSRSNEYLNIIPTDKIVAKGLANPFPAISGALPWIGSYIPVSPPTLAEGNIPIDPVSMDASSLRISPNILVVTITSNCLGARTNCMAQLSTYIWSRATSGYST